MLEKCLNLILRGFVGLVTIMVMNHFLLTELPLCILGINLVTFGVSAFLGIPGVCALYAINLYSLL